MEYLGENLSSAEAERRGRQYDKAKCSYMFTLNAEDDCLDGAKKSGKARFVNENRDNPSCGFRTKSVRCEARVGLFSRRNIECDEELTIAYGKFFNSK